MAAIPSWLWLAIGLIVSVTSWYADMTLFFWLGCAFVVVGVAKIVIGFMLGKTETKAEKKVVQRLAPVQGQRHPAHQYYRCPCGNPVKVSDIFCSYCGRRLR
jgi:hypothetical protein